MLEDALTQKLQTAYSQIAARYADVNATMPAAVLEAAEIFVALLKSPREQANILDLGCGAGRDSAWFGLHGYHVTGMDLSRAMLHQAPSLGIAQLVQVDMQELPLCSGTVDGVWANASMLHIPQASISQVLHECYRVLTAGGLIFVAMQVGNGEVWEDVSYGHAAPRFFARYQPEEFRSLLVSAGFVIHRFDEQKTTPERHWMHFYAYKTD